MKIIHDMLEHLVEELEGATEYAEKYIEHKARGDHSRATKYKEMAHDELNHASTLRDFYLADMDSIKKVYTLTEEETHAWEHGCKKINQHMAMVRQMLNM